MAEHAEQIDNPSQDGTWMVTIPKTELNDLPAAKFKGKIFVIDTLYAAEAAARILNEEKVIGFDTETKPNFRRGMNNKVSLLQLSTHRECFLIRLNKIGLPESIKKVLESESISKIGVSIHDDFHNLDKLFKLRPGGFVELQEYVKDYKIADNSLSRIYAVLFNQRISKNQRLTNWEAEELTSHQQEYAALDAQACISIYEYLESGVFVPEDSKHYSFIPAPEHHDREKSADKDKSVDKEKAAGQTPAAETPKPRPRPKRKRGGNKKESKPATKNK